MQLYFFSKLYILTIDFKYNSLYLSLITCAKMRFMTSSKLLFHKIVGKFPLYGKLLFSPFFKFITAIIGHRYLFAIIISLLHHSLSAYSSVLKIINAELSMFALISFSK